jgi:hypothetical protein
MRVYSAVTPRKLVGSTAARALKRALPGRRDDRRTTKMKARFFAVTGFVGVAALVTACSASDAEGVNVEPTAELSPTTVNTSTTVTYTGQGLNSNPDGQGGYDLNLELCGVANGADVDGPYLLWVFTATGASSASITGPWGTAAMTPSGGGTFKYISAWYSPSTLLPNVVSATYTGKVKNAQLVVSHGCRPYNDKPAWCSPGFWKNADPGAWALIGHTKSELFNGVVYSDYYGTTLASDPTLQTVLGTNNGTYKNPAIAGTLNAACPLSPFNATGAALTSAIPGYVFSCDSLLADESDTCPIDHFGHFKNPQ